jgi:hypothetical protein
MNLSRLRRHTVSWLAIAAASAAVIAGVLVMTTPAQTDTDHTVGAAGGFDAEVVNPGHRSFISGNG